jgi:hypothetical protein
MPAAISAPLRPKLHVFDNWLDPICERDLWVLGPSAQKDVSRFYGGEV